MKTAVVCANGKAGDVYKRQLKDLVEANCRTKERGE